MHRSTAIVLAVLLASCPAHSFAFQSVPQLTDSPLSHHLGPDDPLGDHKLEAQRARSANVERQKSMIRAADHLLELAAELQYNAQRSDVTPSQDEMLRQLATIEKLAHDVKEKMKGSR